MMTKLVENKKEHLLKNDELVTKGWMDSTNLGNIGTLYIVLYSGEYSIFCSIDFSEHYSHNVCTWHLNI